MSAQHTPGPWEIELHRGVWGVVATGRSTPICTCWQALPDGRADANARLIAAAPDLLAVLKTVADYWAGGDVPEDIDSAMRAAIAKAEGRS